MSLYLFVGGLFHGQTTETRMPPQREVVFPVYENDFGPATFRAGAAPEPTTLRTVRYQAEDSPSFVERYFSGWRAVGGGRLRGLLLAPDVQRCGMQLQLMPEPLLVSEDSEGYPAYRRQRERWQQMLDGAEHQALGGVHDSHAVNRPVSPVVRTVEPGPAPWGQTVLRYEWLAEVRRPVRGVQVQGLHELRDLPERISAMAQAVFPEGVPEDLQAIIDRANARVEEKTR